MLTIPNIILRSDLGHLSKESLYTICTDLALLTTGSINDLANRIWEKIKSDSGLQNTALDRDKNKLLCGKTSVTWYRLAAGATLRGAKQIIIDSVGYNPFEALIIPLKEDLTSTPVLIGAAHGESEDEYYLRFMYKSGVNNHYFGAETILTPISSIVTVYINEVTGYIEIRTDSKKAVNIASKLANLIHQNVAIERINIMAPYGNNIENITDILGGTFIDTTAKPELLLEELTADQSNAVLKILKALDAFFAEEDIDVLEQELQEARAELGEDVLDVPFTALVLAGLEKVGFGISHKDLRCSQLYNYLSGYMQHQGGYIQFECPENMVNHKYTIRVGLTTNSIFFATPATENAIKYVRERVIMRSIT